MKLKYVYFILLIIICALLLQGCSDGFKDVSEIVLINSDNGERQDVLPDSDSGKAIINAVKNAKKSDGTSMEPTFEINIISNQESSTYGMSFDIKEKKVNLYKDGTVYDLNGGDSAKLLIDDKFSYIYVKENMPEAKLMKNGTKLDASMRYEWSYRDTEGFEGKNEGMIGSESAAVKLGKNDNLTIDYNDIPDSQITKLYKDGNVVATGNDLVSSIDKITDDGNYYGEVEAKWYKEKNSESYGLQIIEFKFDIDRDADFEVVTKENYPGNVMVIQINNMNESETAKIVTNLAEEAIITYPYKDKGIAMIPIGLNVPAGSEELKVVFNEGKENEYAVTKAAEIKEKAFKTQYLTVTEEMNSTNNDDNSIWQFIQVVKPARAVSEPKKLWDGVFEMPIEGRLTTDYAEIRYVNNEMSSSRHSGLDLAAQTGTEIKSPNNGVVTLAAEGLLSSGNTVVIDHGMGLFTSYYHMDSISAKEGDIVTKGDIIGTVGTTGFSTGPHLHYAVSIYNSYVNPYQTLTGIFE